MSGEATFEAGIFTWTPMNASLPPWHLPRLLLEGKECSYKKAAKPPYFYIMIKPVGISATVVRFSTEPPRDELLRRLKHAHDTAQTLPVPPLVAVYQGLLAARPDVAGAYQELVLPKLLAEKAFWATHKTVVDQVRIELRDIVTDRCGVGFGFGFGSGLEESPTDRCGGVGRDI